MGSVVDVYYNSKLSGELLVTPLKSYHKFMVDVSDDLYGWKKTTLNAIHIATGIFAYPTFAALAILGMVIKFAASCCNWPSPVDFDHLIIHGIGQDYIADCERSADVLKKFLQVLITDPDLFQSCKSGHLFPHLFLIIHGWIQKGGLKFEEEDSMLKQFVDHLKTTGDFERFATSVQDLEILTKDGYRFPVNNAILRMTSEYFVRLMDSEFAEAQALREESPLLAPSQAAQAEEPQALDEEEPRLVQQQPKSIKLGLSSSVVKHYLSFIHSGKLHPSSLSEADGYVLADFARQTFFNEIIPHVSERVTGSPSQCTDLVSLSKFLERIWKSQGKVEVIHSDSQQINQLISKAFTQFFKINYGFSGAFQLTKDRFTIPNTALNLLKNRGCIGAYLRAYVNCISFIELLTDASSGKLTAIGLPEEFWPKIKTIAFDPKVQLREHPDTFGTQIQKIRTVIPAISRVSLSLNQINGRDYYSFSNLFSLIKQKNQGVEVAVSLCDYLSSQITEDQFFNLSHSDLQSSDQIENLPRFACFGTEGIAASSYAIPLNSEIQQFIQRLVTKTGRSLTNGTVFTRNWKTYLRVS